MHLYLDQALLYLGQFGTCYPLHRQSTRRLYIASRFSDINIFEVTSRVGQNVVVFSPPDVVHLQTGDYRIQDGC